MYGICKLRISGRTGVADEAERPMSRQLVEVERPMSRQLVEAERPISRQLIAQQLRRSLPDAPHRRPSSLPGTQQRRPASHEQEVACSPESAIRCVPTVVLTAALASAPTVAPTVARAFAADVAEPRVVACAARPRIPAQRHSYGILVMAY